MERSSAEVEAAAASSSIMAAPSSSHNAWSDDDYEGNDSSDQTRGHHHSYHHHHHHHQNNSNNNNNHHHHHHNHHHPHHHNHHQKRARSMSSEMGVGEREREMRERSSSSVVLPPFGMEQSSDDPSSYEFHHGSRSSNSGGIGGGVGNCIQKQSNSNGMKGTSSFSGETTMTVTTESSPAVCSSSASSKGKGTGSIFFKTKLCCKFRAGTCPYNSNCNFAHGMEELRKPPPGWEEMVAAQEAERASRGQGQAQNECQGPTTQGPPLGQGQGQGQGEPTGPDNARFHKTPRPCRKFYTEEGCPYGDRCIFLHDDQGSQVRVLRESNAISLGPSMVGPPSNGLANNVSGGGNGGGLNERPSNWKTRVCNKWETTGHCPFGQKCHFVHGSSESYNSGSVLKNGSAIATSVMQSQRQVQKSQVKWKGPTDMISTIYGDWIEEDEWEIPPLNVVAG